LLVLLPLLKKGQAQMVGGAIVVPLPT